MKVFAHFSRVSSPGRSGLIGGVPPLFSVLPLLHFSSSSFFYSRSKTNNSSSFSVLFQFEFTREAAKQFFIQRPLRTRRSQREHRCFLRLAHCYWHSNGNNWLAAGNSKINHEKDHSFIDHIRFHLYSPGAEP